jgi:hypothetical protein
MILTREAEDRDVSGLGGEGCSEDRRIVRLKSDADSVREGRRGRWIVVDPGPGVARTK